MQVYDGWHSLLFETIPLSQPQSRSGRYDTNQRWNLPSARLGEEKKPQGKVCIKFSLNSPRAKCWKDAAKYQHIRCLREPSTSSICSMVDRTPVGWTSAGCQVESSVGGGCGRFLLARVTEVLAMLVLRRDRSCFGLNTVKSSDGFGMSCKTHLLWARNEHTKKFINVFLFQHSLEIASLLFLWLISKIMVSSQQKP